MLKNDKISLEAFNIRKATSEDVNSLSMLHVITFNETHGANLNSPSYELRKNQWQKAFQNKNDNWFCFVIEEQHDRLIGFAKGMRYNHSEQAEFSGELNKIYLLREFQKFGLGRKLICLVGSEFITMGVNSMLLFGDARNPSNGFYERMGAEKLFAKNGEFHGGYGWRNLQKLVQAC